MALCEALTLEQRALNDHEKKLFQSVDVKHKYDTASKNTKLYTNNKTGNARSIPYVAHYHVNAILAMWSVCTESNLKPVIRYEETYVIK